jgi:hypothetical protein
VKQSFQGIARTDGCVGVTIPSCVVLDSKLTRTARPLPYCNSQSIFLLHVFTLPKPQKRAKGGPRQFL